MLSRFLVLPPFSVCLVLQFFIYFFFAHVTISHLTEVSIFPPQVIFNAQKTGVPGDLILVPGATEKISFQKESKQQ